MRRWFVCVTCVLVALLALGSAPAWADWLQYAVGPLPVRVTGYRACRGGEEGTECQARKPPVTGTREVVFFAGTITFPVLDACAGRPIWTLITDLTLPLQLTALSVRPGIGCFRGQEVSSMDDVDLIVQEALENLENAPLLRPFEVLDRATHAACAGDPNSTDCALAMAAQAAIATADSQTRQNRRKRDARLIAQQGAQIHNSAIVFKDAHPELP